MVLTMSFLAMAAFFAGLIDSIAGGGGLISLPALLAAGVPPHMALGTNKMQSTFGTSFALANFHRNAKVVWKIAFVGIPFALLGSVLGAKLAIVIPQTYLARLLIVLLPPAAALMFTSKMLVRGRPGESVGMMNVPDRGFRWDHSMIITILICMVIGIYDGFFGPGTGTFLIVALVMFLNVSLVEASATAKTFNLASNAGALFTFIFSGHVDYKIGILMAAANVGGNLLGSHLAMKKGDSFVQKAVFVSITLLFGYLVWKYYF